MTTQDTADEVRYPDPAWAHALGAALKGQRPGSGPWKLCLIDGPNMSNLGRGAGRGGRDPRTYGVVSSLAALQDSMTAFARGLGAQLRTFESYHEADLVAHVYETGSQVDAFLINPAALTRFGVPFRIALTDVARPYVELHFSNISAIGWEKGGATTPSAFAVVMGLRQYSYIGALFALVCTLDAQSGTPG